MNDFDRIAEVIRYVDAHRLEQPSLAELARQAGLSPPHFHRLFARWAGITPKDFLQCLTLTHARAALQNGQSVLDAALDAGLSGPGRLHDLCVNLEAATPGEVKSGGEGWTIRTGFADSPFGICLVGESSRGICHLSFVDSRDHRKAESDIRRDWPCAGIDWDTSVAGPVADAIGSPDSLQAPLRTIVKGTEFQLRVWRALLQIPSGTLTSYGAIADALGNPRAARAVGSAVARNQIAYLIPCHRVIRETGIPGNYRWGAARKRAIVVWEALGTSHPSADVSRASD